MKTILVTGGAGHVGKAVVARLVQNGYTVRVLGLPADEPAPGAEYVVCDILDFDRLRELVRGCEGIVHLAAYKSPEMAPNQKIFLTNTQGTFNVFKAAEDEGIRRIVQASSINAAGMYYGRKPAPLHYLPLDEDHPVYGTDVYSFSKHVVEDIVEYFWRRSGISSVALRFPWVAPAEAREYLRSRSNRLQGLVARVQQLSPQEHLTWFEAAWKKFNELRALGIYEDEELFQTVQERETEFLTGDYIAMSSRVNFFAVVDERDAAQAVERGLSADYEGSFPLFINDDRNWGGLPAALLLRLFYPDVSTLKALLEGDAALVSIARAQKLLGFRVEYSINATPQ